MEHELELKQVEAAAPELHHHISHLQNSPLKLRNFLQKTPGDPAKKVGPHIENRGNDLIANLKGFPAKTLSTPSCADVRSGL